MSRPLPRVHLKPGELCIAAETTVIGTVLGSCLAICLWGGRPGVGAMCHALLPTAAAARGGEPAGRFVDSALDVMLDGLARLGVLEGQLKAKVLGGADMFTQVNPNTCRLSVGRQNIEMAEHLLREHGIPLVAQNTGGPAGRKIFFHTGSGEVRLKWLGPLCLRAAA